MHPCLHSPLVGTGADQCITATYDTPSDLECSLSEYVWTLIRAYSLTCLMPPAGVGSIRAPPVMSTADEMGEPLSPSNGRLEGESTSLESSAGLSAGGAFRPRCGRASAEFLRTNGMLGHQVGQLSQLYAPTQQAVLPVGVLPQGMQGMLGGRGSGLVGAMPYGGIGQIPEHPEAHLAHSSQMMYSGQLGHSGSYVPKPAPRISGPINRLIGPLPTSHEPPPPAPMQYGVGGVPVGMHGMVGQYPSVGQLPGYSSLGGYQMHSQPQYQVPGAYPTGSMAQMDDRMRRATYPNGFSMQQRQSEARQMFQQQSGGPPVSHIGTTSQHMSDSGSGRNVGEISQQSLANSLHAPKVSAAGYVHESPRSGEMSQVLHYLQGWQPTQHRPPDQYHYNSYGQQPPADHAPHYSGGGRPPQQSVSHHKLSVLLSRVHAALPLDLQVLCSVIP